MSTRDLLLTPDDNLILVKDARMAYLIEYLYNIIYKLEGFGNLAWVVVEEEDHRAHILLALAAHSFLPSYVSLNRIIR